MVDDDAVDAQELVATLQVGARRVHYGDDVVLVDAKAKEGALTTLVDRWLHEVP